MFLSVIELKAIMKQANILLVICMILVQLVHCVVLPETSGYIKYFENGRKNMSFKIDDESVYIKYSQIWNRVKDLLNVRFHSEPIYDDKYVKTKVKTFSNMINTLFLGNEIPRERIHYVCIAAICIDSVLRIDKKKISTCLFRTV